VSKSVAEYDDKPQELIEELESANQHSSYGKFQETLRRILSQKRFREEGQKSDKRSNTWVAKVNWNFDGNLLRYAVLFIGIAALILVTVYLMKGIRDNLISDVQERKTETIAEEPITAKDALNQAQEFETHSDFRNAIRALYLATLLYLHERDILTYDKSATNREYLRQLEGQPSLQNALKSAVYIFDDVWYGYKPCTADTLAEYRSLVKMLEGV